MTPSDTNSKPDAGNGNTSGTGERERARWTSDRKRELMTLALNGLTCAETAARMGLSPDAIRSAANRFRISFGGRGEPMSDPDELRARWLAELPRLKANLRTAIRSEVEQIMAEGEAR